MILTGKAKEDFEKWLRESYYSYYLSAYGFNPEACNNALIIEWFDGVGIYIEVGYSYILGNKFWCLVSINKNYSNTPYTDTRQEATKQAILKANEIYNASNTKKD